VEGVPAASALVSGVRLAIASVDRAKDPSGVSDADDREKEAELSKVLHGLSGGLS